MATGLIRNMYHAARRVVARNYAVTRLVQNHFQRQANDAYKAATSAHKAAVQGYKAAARAHQQQSRLHQKSVKARVGGVQQVTRGVTKGNRVKRAQQLKTMRANPAQRQQLRRRVKYATKMPVP